MAIAIVVGCIIFTAGPSLTESKVSRAIWNDPVLRSALLGRCRPFDIKQPKGAITTVKAGRLLFDAPGAADSVIIRRNDEVCAVRGASYRIIVEPTLTFKEYSSLANISLDARRLGLDEECDTAIKQLRQDLALDPAQFYWDVLQSGASSIRSERVSGCRGVVLAAIKANDPYNTRGWCRVDLPKGAIAYVHFGSGSKGGQLRFEYIDSGCVNRAIVEADTWEKAEEVMAEILSNARIEGQ